MLKYLHCWNIVPAVIILLLTACETRRPVTATAASQAKATPDSAAAAAASVHLFAVADTVEPYPGWNEQSDTARVVQVQFDGQIYYLSTASHTDSTQTFTADNKAIDESLVGFQRKFSVTLRDAQKRSVFARHLRKQDFADTMYPHYAAHSVGQTLEYLGYWPQAHALVFSADLILPSTDDSVLTLAVLDAATGRTRQVVTANYFGGTDLNGEAFLVSDGKVLVTAHYLLYPNGRRRPLQRKTYEVAGVRMINNQTILVDYEPAEGGEADAAQTLLLNLQGNMLKAFPFSSSSEGSLGYSLSDKYVRQTRTHYFYDERARALLLVPQDQPLQAQRQPLTALQQFQPPQRATEVKFDFYPESNEQIIMWADTISGQLRYQRRALF